MAETDGARPLPEPTETSKPFWEAAADGRLLIQRCNDCATPIMYPKRFCPTCLGDDLGWFESAGAGSVYTFTIQERGAPTGFSDRVPYVLAVVRLDEGVQLMTNIVGPDAHATRCDDRVQVAFEDVADGRRLPVFRRVG